MPFDIRPQTGPLHLLCNEEKNYSFYFYAAQAAQGLRSMLPF
jgi:hypothetical protein